MFVFSDSSHEVRNIQNDYDKPRFQESDVGKVLGIKNIRMSIADFDEDESYVSKLTQLSEKNMSHFSP